MISKIKLFSFLGLVIFMASCASSGPVKPAGVQKKVVPVVTPVKKISVKSTASSFTAIFGSRDPRLAWWGLYDQAPAIKRSVKPERNFEVFQKREFLFEKPQKHDFEKVTPRILMGMREYSVRAHSYDWKGMGYRLLAVLISVLLGSIVWRGISLIGLFFGLWRRYQRESFFSKDLIATSNLVPPVSLFLSTQSLGSDLLTQITAVEGLDYEEVELIIFRDLKSKDADAMLLKDYRLRFRSPLYFADLDTEEPFEILEVQGERRILLVYSDKKTRRPSLTLFLKLARYPLVGFLREGVVLNSEAIVNLVFRWLRDGEKSTCVYGYLDAVTSGPSAWIQHEAKILNGIGVNNLESWIQNKNFFGLMPKSMAIQLMEFGGGRYQSTLWSELPSYEIVGNEASAVSPIKDFVFWSMNFFRNLSDITSVGFSWKLVKQIADKTACFLAVVIWPLIVLNLAVLLALTKKIDVSVGYLAGSELLLVILASAIWLFFPRSAIQNLFPARSGLPILEKQQVSA